MKNVFARNWHSKEYNSNVKAPCLWFYRNTRLDCGYRMDVIVERILVLELKAVDAILPIHHAQLLTYLKLGGWKVGLLINFNVPLLRQGIKRIVLGL